MNDCGIYCITNLINNKKYIGQSIQIHVRWSQHQRCVGMAHNSAISRAIYKYGVENFKFEVLEYCQPKELNEKEAYYAAFFNTYAPNGYNINIAGEAWHNAAADQEVSCYDLKSGVLIRTFASLHEADRAGYCRTAVAGVCQHKPRCSTAYDMLWAYGHEPIIQVTKPKAGRHGGRTVYQYDLKTGDFIQDFKSLADAERSLNKPGGNKNISAACLGKRHYAYGYYWSYELYSNFLTKEKK